MSATPIKILFVTHISDRSGAPLLLLEIVRAAVRSGDFVCSVLSGEDGPLLSQFEEQCATHVWKRKRTVTRWRLANRLMRYWDTLLQGVHERRLVKQFKGQEVILYNTFVNGAIQRKLSGINARNICYVHELEAVVDMLTSIEDQAAVIKYTNQFFCVSDAVKDFLVRKFKVPPLKIQWVPSPMNESDSGKLDYLDFATDFRRRMKVEKSVIAGIAAGNEWRKGFDLLIPLVNLYFSLYKDSDVVFVWKGFKEKAISAYFDRFDFSRFANKDKIILLPHDGMGLHQIATFDIHLLLSREDPYPLVVLEAANLGIPTVCFSGSGGAPEFVGDDAGFSVPYLDLYVMCERIHKLAQDKELRDSMGMRAKEKLQERHDKKESLAKILSLIKQESLLND